MNDIFEKNLNSIKKHHKNIDINKILDYKKNEKYVVESSKDKNKTIKVLKNDKYIYLNSTLFIENLDLENSNQIYFFGMGFGYHIRHLINISSSSITIIEPEYNIFNELIRNVDICDILNNEKIKFIFEPSEQDFKIHLEQTLNWKNIEYFNFFNFSPYKIIYEKQFIYLNKVATEAHYATFIIKNTVLNLAKAWNDNTIANFKYFFDEYYYLHLKDKFKNIPVVIVSAGPSLNKNIHLLKKVKGKALIICTYTAFNIVMKNGVEPDLVVSIDPKQLKFADDFEKESVFSTTLLTNESVCNTLLKKHKGKKIIIINPNNTYYSDVFEKFGKEFGTIQTGGSVANDTLDFSVKIGANPIIMIGQDFAYTENKTHVDGTYYDKKNSVTDIIHEKIYIEDINNEKILTSYDLYGFLKWTNDYIENTEKNTLFIDATEGGAKIKGTEIMTFQNAIDKYCLEDKTEEFKSIFEDFYKKGFLFTKEEKQILINDLNETATKFLKTEKLLEDAIYESENLMKLFEDESNIKNNLVSKTIDNLNKIDEKIASINCNMKLIEYQFQLTAYEIEKIEQTQKNEGLKVANKSYLIYKGMKNAMEQTRPNIIKAIEDLK